MFSVGKTAAQGKRGAKIAFHEMDADFQKLVIAAQAAIQH
jgi:hypothetical protein